MNQITHKITLSSLDHFGKRLPPQPTGLFLTELPLAVRYAVSMALRSRSIQKGKRPGWLERAADVRLVGMDGNGASTLFFEAPPLGEAAAEFYAQGDMFWTPPRSEDTGFDLLGDVLKDVEAANADSERFDRPLLRRLLRFRGVFRSAFSDIQLETRRHPSGEQAHISRPVLQTAEKFLDQTPASRRVRVVGTLDMVRASNQTFALRTEEGEELRGVLVSGIIEEMACLLNQSVLVFGRAVFRPSGRLLRIDVDEFRAAQAEDRFFAKVPRPMIAYRPRPTPRERQQAAEGLRAAMGKWPGDETEEQIHQALEELS